MNSNLKMWLFNPFEFIAGSKSLLYGIAILMATAFLGWAGNIYYDGVIDIHAGGKSPLVYHLLEIIVVWLVVSVLMFIAGLIVSKSKIRLIDVFGTMALARWPLLIVSIFGLLVPMEVIASKVSASILYNTLQVGEAVDVATWEFIVFSIFTLLSLLVVVWIVALMWNAFKVSCNVKGPVAIFSFILVLIISELVSKKLLSVLLQYFHNNSI
jgi:hypothetical protein